MDYLDGRCSQSGHREPGETPGRENDGELYITLPGSTNVEIYKIEEV